MAEAAEKPAEGAKEKKGGGGIVGMVVNGLGIFVLSLGAVVVGGIVNEKLHPRQEFTVGADGKLALKDPHAGDAKTDGKPAPAMYYAFDPPFIVNFDDDQAVRFLQLQIQALAREQAVLDALKLHEPLVRNNLLMLMNGRDYKSLMDRDGKEKLRQECLKEIQRILTKETGKPGVEDLLFTSFVVQ